VERAGTHTVVIVGFFFFAIAHAVVYFKLFKIGKLIIDDLELDMELFWRLSVSSKVNYQRGGLT
jgi:hypothetical protein